MQLPLALWLYVRRNEVGKVLRAANSPSLLKNVCVDSVDGCGTKTSVPRHTLQKYSKVSKRSMMVLHGHPKPCRTHLTPNLAKLQDNFRGQNYQCQEIPNESLPRHRPQGQTKALGALQHCDLFHNMFAASKWGTGTPWYRNPHPQMDTSGAKK